MNATISTWEDCMHECKKNLLCAQVVFDKNLNKCTGHTMLTKKKMNMAKNGLYVPGNFISGHCWFATTEESAKLIKRTELEMQLRDSLPTSLLEGAIEVEDARQSEFEKAMVAEELMAAYEDKMAHKERLEKLHGEAVFKIETLDSEVEKVMHHAEETAGITPTDSDVQAPQVVKSPRRMDSEAKFKEATSEIEKRSGAKIRKGGEVLGPLLLKQKIMNNIQGKITKRWNKKCTTYPTANLVKQGSLLQMGEKMVAPMKTPDFWSCLEKCHMEVACKQVVYDKHSSSCYKHESVVAKKSAHNDSKYIAATCL